MKRTACPAKRLRLRVCRPIDAKAQPADVSRHDNQDRLRRRRVIDVEDRRVELRANGVYHVQIDRFDSFDNGVVAERHLDDLESLARLKDYGATGEDKINAVRTR